MSLYHDVWAPDGTKFEVPPEKAADLVLNQGWSNTPPKSETPSKKKGKLRVKDAAPVADTTEDSEIVVTTFGDLDSATKE